MPRARIILARGPDPRFEPYDRFRHRARNVDRTMSSLLAELARLRSANLDELRAWPLGPAELARRGHAPAAGRRSRCGSCWRRGWCTTSSTSRRPRG